MSIRIKLGIHDLLECPRTGVREYVFTDACFFGRRYFCIAVDLHQTVIKTAFQAGVFIQTVGKFAPLLFDGQQPAFPAATVLITPFRPNGSEAAICDIWPCTQPFVFVRLDLKPLR